MAWFKKERKPRTSERVRLEIPADAWEKCDECGHIDIKDRFVRAFNVCPNCGHHRDRKSTRLNSSHEWISYAVFCLKKKNKQTHYWEGRRPGRRRQLG